MGSGKTTIGKKLANRLLYDFIDSDEEIEKNENQSISEIFDEKGESYFRKLETDFLLNFNSQNKVISLGGGTPCFNNNMEIINKKGISVYLKLPVETIHRRLMDSKNKRPLIEQFKENPEALKKQIESMIREREIQYEKASIKIDALNMNSLKINSLIELIQLT